MKPFIFKQFKIYQDQTAMKVGTDGVLLGAWANFDNPKTILDIGTGTGVIALMLAQKNLNSNISAIEIDEKAFIQAKNNFEISSWGNRIDITHSSLQDFKPNYKFDLIVSNPPFFNNSFKAKDTQRNIARHTNTLSFDDLLKQTSSLLSKNGKAYFILPFSVYKTFLANAEKYLLFPNKILFVKGNKHSEIKRFLVQFSFQKTETITNELVIEISRHQYTEDYIELVQDFYFKM